MLQEDSAHAYFQVGLQGGEHEREAALLVSLERISIWACHSRLCIAMVFAMAMQDLASALKGDQNTSDAGKVMHAAPTSWPLAYARYSLCRCLVPIVCCYLWHDASIAGIALNIVILLNAGESESPRGVQWARIIAHRIRFSHAEQ